MLDRIERQKQEERKMIDRDKKLLQAIEQSKERIETIPPLQIAFVKP